MIGWTPPLTPDLVIAGYRSGAFPMPLDVPDIDMVWWSPMRRGILPLDKLRVTKSLRKSVERYQTSVDQAWEDVVDRCADPARPGGWIDSDIRQVYGELHRQGVVHSVETWDREGRLVGGLYGVSINGLFAGESMFHDPEFGRDASKVALVRLVDELRRHSPHMLLDVQWRTPHLASLGVEEISRADYLARLSKALELPPLDWSTPRRIEPSATHRSSWS